MPKERRSKPKQTQHEKFVALARESGANESESAFVGKLKKIAAANPGKSDVSEEIAEYARGYQDGWRSIEKTMAARVPDRIPPRAKRPDQSAYEAGYEQGRAIAGGK